MADEQVRVYSWMEERVLNIRDQLGAIQDGQSEIAAVKNELVNTKEELSAIGSQLKELRTSLGKLEATQNGALTADEFRKAAKRESALELPWWLLSVGLGVASLAVAMSLSTLTLIAAFLIWLASACFVGVALSLGRERLEMWWKARTASGRAKERK